MGNKTKNNAPISNTVCNEPVERPDIPPLVAPQLRKDGKYRKYTKEGREITKTEL